MTVAVTVVHDGAGGEVYVDVADADEDEVVPLEDIARALNAEKELEEPSAPGLTANTIPGKSWYSEYTGAVRPGEKTCVPLPQWPVWRQ